MQPIQWSEDFDVKDEKMNAQHKILFGYVNDWIDACNTGKGPEDFQRIFANIVNFTKYHFRDEEAMMESIGFTGLSGHKLIHEQLLNQVLQHKQSLEAGEAGVETAIGLFLKNWLVAHIKGIDKKYGDFKSD